MHAYACIYICEYIHMHIYMLSMSIYFYIFFLTTITKKISEGPLASGNSGKQVKMLKGGCGRLDFCSPTRLLRAPPPHDVPSLHKDLPV